MKRSFQVFLCVSVLHGFPGAALAQHEHDDHGLEEIIVSGLRDRERSGTALPVNVLSGEALRENAAATLGETLDRQVGVTSASFGPGVGRPVIRGQSGHRVQVLQDGLGALDASSASQDHANAVEPLLAERVEVIRGPATLLYGGGAIGGVVNVIDNRVPERVPGALNGAVELRHNTGSSGDTGVFRLDGGGGAFAWHLDALARQSGDLEIPGAAVDEQALERLHEGHEHEEGEEEEEIENTVGFIANSDTEARSVSAGASWIGERGFWGAAVSRLDNEYGLPPGAHGHDEEEEPGHEGEEEEDHGDDVRLDMEQRRIDVKGGIMFDGFFEQLRVHLAASDYKHRELEGDAVGTVFDNEGVEARLALHHGGATHGVWGVQLIDRDFSAVGEEAFIPPAAIENAGVFAVETLERDRWTYEFGLRLDTQLVDPAMPDCDRDDTAWSAGASALWDFRADANLFASLNRSERAPAVEELFSNIRSGDCTAPADPADLVPHAATARLEIGDPSLAVETSNNLELGLRKHAGGLRGELNVFYNDIADYIFLQDTGEFEETIVSRYSQQDATFSGLEARLTVPFELEEGRHVDLTLFADAVRARLDGGGNVPRTPPARAGAELALAWPEWIARVRVTRADEQDKAGVNELPTDGYTRVDLYLDYHLTGGQSDWLLFLKGRNLTDETIRNHVSFLKHYAPEAGRSWEFGLRWTF